MNILNLTKTFNNWMKTNSISKITQSINYSKYEIERMICDENMAKLLHDDSTSCIGKCRHTYLLDMIHSTDEQPHIFEFEAIGYGQKENNKLINFTYIDFIITNK